jgi:cell division protein FtsB
VDEGGVALAAIQGLNEKLEVRSEKLEAENAELKAKVTDLQSQLDGLQKAVARLVDKSASPLALNTPPQEAK